MVCSFCRVNGHNKTNCNHPAVITVQKEYLYAISRMICSAYVRRITPLALKRELEEWLLVIPLQHQRFIVGYLKNITRRPTVGNTESHIANVNNILNIMFQVCRIDVQSVNISDSTNVFAFSPRSTDLYGFPHLYPINSSVTHSLFKEFLDATRFNTEIDNIQQRVEYSSNRWVVISRSPYIRGRNASISQQTVDIILSPSTAPPPPEGGSPRPLPTPLPTPLATPYAYREQLTPMPAVVARPAVIVPAYRPVQVRPAAARVDTQVVVKLLEYQVLKLDEEDCKDGGECPICYEDLTKETFVKLNCSHTFCKSCIKHCIERKMMTCSMCRRDVTHIYTPTPVVQYSL